MEEEKELDHSLKLIAKTSIIVFIGLSLSKVFTYLYRIIIARYFGPEVYGLFSLAIMVVGWFVAVSCFGLMGGLVRYIPIYRGKKEFNKIKFIFKFVITILFFSSIIAGLILFFSANFISLKIFHNSDLIIFLKLFSFLIPLWIFSNIFLSVLRAFEKISWYSFILNVLQSIAKVVAILFLIFLGFKTNAVIFSYLLAFLIILIVAFLVCKYKIQEIFGDYKLEKSVRKKITKEFISYSWPLLFSGIITSIFYWIDLFSIGYFKGALEVGFYNAAVPIVLLMTFVPLLFSQLFFPLITKEFARKNLEIIKELSKQVGKWVFIFNLPLFIIMILFPGAIINILFGSTYLVAENALRILAVGGFFSSLFFISENLISMIGKSKLLLMNIVIISIINLFLNFILVPIYGINGAATSTAFVWVLLSVILMIEGNYYLSIIPLRKKMIKIFLVSIPPLLVVLYIRSLFQINLVTLILTGILFILSYLLLILLTGCLDKNDIMVLRSLKKKIFSS